MCDIDLLMQWPLLAGLAQDVRTDVLKEARRQRFRPREVLFREGDPSEGMHMIDQGWVALRLTTPRGDIATVAVIGPGEVLGEQSLLEEAGRRTASAVAIKAVETLYLSREAFTGLRRQDPSVDRVLNHALSERLQRVTARLVEALYQPAPRRVVCRMAELADCFGPGSPIPLTQEDIATLAGTTRQTVNRVCTEAENKRLIQMSRGHFTVLDANGLARMVGI